MKVSVIVPAYNCADYLGRCLESLQRQSLGSLEILVCDDCSSDGTSAIIKDAAARDVRIRPLSTNRPCGSPAVPRNIALAHANGEYVGFVDADDWVDHNMFAELLGAADGADIVSASHFFLHEDGGTAKKEINYTTIDEEAADRENVFRGHFSHVLHRIYRTDFLRRNRITFPFLRISEDYCFSAACHLFARRTRAAGGGWYHYNRNRPDSTTRQRRGALGLDNINFFTDGIGYFRRLGLWPDHGPLLLRALLPSLAYTYSRLEESYREIFKALLHHELAAQREMFGAETLGPRELELLRTLDVGLGPGEALTFDTDSLATGHILAVANRLYDSGDYRNAARLYRLGEARRPSLANDLQFLVTEAQRKAESQDPRRHWLPTPGRAHSDPRDQKDRNPSGPRSIAGQLLTWPSPRKIYEGGRRIRNPRAERASHGPLVTVVTTVRNDEGRIGQCLESVRRQTHPCVEHLVIDAASTDGTLEIIRRHEKAIDYVLSEPDEGIYAGINKGVQLAAGQYILVLNADDYLEPDGIAKLVALAEESEADLVFGSARLIGRDDQMIGLRHSQWNASVYLRCPARHGAMLARARAYDIVGLYDPAWRIIGDMVWMQKAYGHGLSVDLIEEPVFNFRQGGISSPDSDLHHQELLAHFKAGFPGVDPNVLASLVRAIRLTEEQITAIAHAYPHHSRLLEALAPLMPEPSVPTNPPALQCPRP